MHIKSQFLAPLLLRRINLSLFELASNLSYSAHATLPGESE